MIFMRKQFKFSIDSSSAVAKLRVVLGVSGDEASTDTFLFDLIYSSLKRNKDVTNPFCTGLLQTEISRCVSSLKSFHSYWFDAKSFDHNTSSLPIVIFFFVCDFIYSHIKDDCMKTKLRL